ncbi:MULTISPECIES: hypothetical protein [Caballeronia]|uniref:Transmembrane protein n=1 Tax=Caballeronia cordobensis TaxID=1353886 RepID=A0A158FPU4_CABCO|nr:MULTISPECIES: hypothetical protein [Caballeronia]AET88922.1 hypothetical protein BYI23_A010840 [Burkholderia sp. YI23]BAO86174.1 putative uncharacterized protein [Burkholderia sp. RPE67]MCE4542038.1 hypothetical protein [Caballeronia sp. PC1]MCE4568916.1 hypothetical protein [Caballeronia sp. CLC5]SAL21884.1 hypothetical protein AWB70_01162 [Caballeronia cordobensis]
MKPLLRVVLVVNALIFVAFGVLFLLTPWPGLYGALQLDSIRVQPAFAGQLLGLALVGLAWLAFHAAVDGALTARAARVSGHVEWLSGVIVLVWLLGLKTPQVDGFGQMSAAVVGIVLLVLGLGSVRLSSAVRRRERAAQAGAASAQRAEKKAAQKREVTRAEAVDTPRPAARAPDATAIDPVSGRAIDSSGRPLDPASPISPISPIPPAAVRAHPDGAVDPVTGGTLDPVTGRAIDPVTGRRIEPVISGEIDPATGRRVDPLAPDAGRAPR